jgi:hypothetical protein
MRSITSIIQNSQLVEVSEIEHDPPVLTWHKE